MTAFLIAFLIACLVVVVQQIKLRTARADLTECRWELNEAAHEIDVLRTQIRNLRKAPSRKAGIIERART